MNGLLDTGLLLDWISNGNRRELLASHQTELSLMCEVTTTRRKLLLHCAVAGGAVAGGDTALLLQGVDKVRAEHKELRSELKKSCSSFDENIYRSTILHRHTAAL